MSTKKHLSFLDLLYKKKEKIPCDFLIDEIDVDSYLFLNFLDVCVVQNRVPRLSKGLFSKVLYSFISLRIFKAQNLA